MTDLPISQQQSAHSAGSLATAFAGMVSLYRAARDGLAQATARNAERRALRRAPEEILAAQARREEARRAVDRLLQRR